QAVRIFIVFVGSVRKYRRYPEVVLAFMFLALEEVVIFGQRLNAVYTEHGGKSFTVRLAVMIVDDIVRNLIQALRALQKFLRIDILYGNIHIGWLVQFI